MLQQIGCPEIKEQTTTLKLCQGGTELTHTVLMCQIDLGQELIFVERAVAERFSVFWNSGRVEPSVTSCQIKGKFRR